MSPSQDGINTVQVSKEHLYVITAKTLQHFLHRLRVHFKVLMGISFTLFFLTFHWQMHNVNHTSNEE